MVADDAQMENIPTRPLRRKKRFTLKGLKNLKSHFGLNLGTALVPQISFAAVPNYPKPVLTKSRVAKAVFYATWAGQTILCANNFPIQTEEETNNETADPGYETIPISHNTVEEDVFELANDNISLDNYGENTFDYNGNSFETTAEVTPLPLSTNSAVKNENLYAVPNRKLVKVVPANTTVTKRRTQVEGLETLKLMRSKKSESALQINKRENVQKPWQSETNVTLAPIANDTEFVTDPVPEIASQRAEFMENLHRKLELLRREVLETVEENKRYQQQKELWAEKLNEANQILEENMVLKHDIRHLEQTVDESRHEVQQLKRELLALKDVTGQINTQSNDLIEENASLKRQCYQLKLQAENSMPIVQHNLIINEIKLLLENLKTKYQEEVDHLYSQLGSTRQECSHMKVEVVKLKDHSTQLKFDNATLYSNLQETLEKCQQLLTQLKATHQWGDTAQDLLTTMIHVAEHTAEERNELAAKQQLAACFQSKQQAKAHKFVSVLLKRTVSLGRLQESLNAFKVRSIERVRQLEEIIEEKEIESTKEKHSLETEIEILKAALEDRDEKLKALVRSKRRLEKDLDEVWVKHPTTSEVTAIPC